MCSAGRVRVLGALGESFYLPLDGAFDLPPPEGLLVVLGHPPPLPWPRPPPPLPLLPLPLPPFAILYPLVNLLLLSAGRLHPEPTTGHSTHGACSRHFGHRNLASLPFEQTTFGVEYHWLICTFVLAAFFRNALRLRGLLRCGLKGASIGDGWAGVSERKEFQG